uniref:microtubule-severing ATPase n=1 Tax=Eutreptiella gymnastica TaxID=73025 RepID=A0A7S1I5R6_9EUGL
MAKERGAKVVKSFNKKTTHVLTTPKTMSAMTKKLDRAVDMGLSVVDIEWFFECVNQEKLIPPGAYTLVPENAYVRNITGDDEVSLAGSLARSSTSPVDKPRDEANSHYRPPQKRRRILAVDSSRTEPCVRPKPTSIEEDLGFEDKRPWGTPDSQLWGLRPSIGSHADRGSPQKSRPAAAHSPTRAFAISPPRRKPEVVAQVARHTRNPLAGPQGHPTLFDPLRSNLGRPTGKRRVFPTAPHSPSSASEPAQHRASAALATHNATPSSLALQPNVSSGSSIAKEVLLSSVTIREKDPAPARAPLANRTNSPTRPLPMSATCGDRAALRSTLAHAKSSRPSAHSQARQPSKAEAQGPQWIGGKMIKAVTGIFSRGGTAPTESGAAVQRPPSPRRSPRTKPQASALPEEQTAPAFKARPVRPAAVSIPSAQVRKPTGIASPTKKEEGAKRPPGLRAPLWEPKGKGGLWIGLDTKEEREKVAPQKQSPTDMASHPGKCPPSGVPAAPRVHSLAEPFPMMREDRPAPVSGPLAGRPPWNSNPDPRAASVSPDSVSSLGAELGLDSGRSGSEKELSPSRPAREPKPIRKHVGWGVEPKKNAFTRDVHSRPAVGRASGVGGAGGGYNRHHPYRPNVSIMSTTGRPRPGAATAAATSAANRRVSQSSRGVPTGVPSRYGSPQKKKKDKDEEDEHPLVRKIRSSEYIKNVDEASWKQILREVVDTSKAVLWDDISGLENAKQILRESVILPSKRPDLFTGLRKPPKGLLLFGPPGNGKTLLAKAVASQCESTFFNISASSLTSKWVGEGEKMVRALFAVARALQPSVVFIDEVDSLLTARNTNEHEASRRLKTEYLVQMDGVGTDETDRILILAATNRPHELDDAAIRRFTKRVYIPMPDGRTRRTLAQHLLKAQRYSFSDEDWLSFIERTEGYSGSDLTSLCTELAMQPLRELGELAMEVALEDIRAIGVEDFLTAIRNIRPSVSKELMATMERWNANFGSTA